MKDTIKFTFECSKTLEAPVFQGFKIGNVKIELIDSTTSNIIGNYNIIVDSNINKKNGFTYFVEFLKQYKKFAIF